MSVKDIAELIIAAATLLSAIAACIASLRNAKQIERVHLSINSRMDQLLASGAIAAFARGREEERKLHTPTPPDE